MRALTNNKTGARRILMTALTVAFAIALSACSKDGGNNNNNGFYDPNCVSCGGTNGTQASSLLMGQNFQVSTGNQLVATFYNNGNGQFSVEGVVYVQDFNVCLPPGTYYINNTGLLNVDQSGALNGYATLSGPINFDLEIYNTSVQNNFNSEVSGVGGVFSQQIVGSWYVSDQNNPWNQQPCNIGITYNQGSNPFNFGWGI